MGNQYLGRTVRVKTKDGRALYGVLVSYTHHLDIIINDAIEQQPVGNHIRQVGYVVVPSEEVTQFSTTKLAASSVQYSPFIDNRLAVGASANFGIVGNGKVFCLEIASNGVIHAAAAFDTQDSVYDVAWSEVHENHFVAGCGDGSIQLFDCTRAQHPLIVHKEHTREVFDIDWNLVNKHQYCSCSWDGTIKLWSANGNLKSLTTLTTGPGVVYEAKYSPHSANLITSASADGSVKVWDIRNGQQPSLAFNGTSGSGECMTVDWNKYRPQTVASAGSDGVIRVWDLRNSAQLVNELRGHQLAVKSVKWSPHSAHHLLSASYDMTAKVWANNQSRAVPAMGPRGLVSDFKRHTEFVTDCDWSLWGEPGWVATASFDSNVYIWKTQG